MRDYYVRTRRDRGWTYHDAAYDPSPTASMTAAALVGLAAAARHDKTPDAGREAFDLGMKRFLAMPAPATKSAGYLALVTAELGRTTGAPAFKSGDTVVVWYRDGATKLLKEQRPDGSWVLGKGLDADDVLSTAFALYFLGPPEKR